VRSEKEPVLRANRYRYDFDRMVYYNRTAKKAFSVEWLEEHTDDDLKRALAERNETNGWKIYMDARPSQAVIDAFLAEVNG